MAVAQGYGKIVTSGSVFAYDTGDTRNSYRGEPTVNIYSTDGFSFWQLDGNHTATRYPGNAPELTTITNNYDYHTIVATGNWSSEVNRALVWTNSGLLQLSTQYAVSFYARVTSTSTADIGAAFYGNSLPNTLTLTNQWQRFTVLTSTTSTYRPFEFGSKSGAITFQIAGLQYEAKTHTTPYINGTRSSTQGLLPVIGNSTIDLTNVSFDSNAQMTFDGTDDLIDVTTNLGTLSAYTFEYVSYSNSAGNMPLSSRTSTAFYKYGAYSWRYTHGGVGGEFYHTYGSDTGWAHWVITYDGATIKVYENNIPKGTSASSGTADFTGGIRIGSWTSSASYTWDGTIPIMKMYNRALTAGEVRQNYLHYKTRFNLS